MKKILFFVCALMSMAPVFAQSDDGEDEIIVGGSGKSNAFFFGPKIGGVLTSMTQPDEGKLYDGAGFGISGGLAFKARFGKATENSAGGTGYWGFGLELKYKQNSVKTLAFDEDGDKNAKLSIGYFEVPIYAQIYPFVKSNGMNTFYVELGASIAGTLSRSPKSLTLLEPNDNYSQVTYNIDTDGSKLKGFDIRPLVGVGYTLPNSGLDINARYYVGTSELAGNLPCKMSSFEISLAWLFNIGLF